MGGGSLQWRSPESFDPKIFNLEDSPPTKSSDCYSFRMVIYEVLSGQLPFFGFGRYAVVLKVLSGERPKRPRGEERWRFTVEVWSLLQRCWEPTPGHRPKAGDILDSLVEVSVSVGSAAQIQLQMPGTEGNPNQNIISPSAYPPLDLLNDDDDHRAPGIIRERVDLDPLRRAALFGVISVARWALAFRASFYTVFGWADDQTVLDPVFVLFLLSLSFPHLLIVLIWRRLCLAFHILFV